MKVPERLRRLIDHHPVDSDSAFKVSARVCAGKQAEESKPETHTLYVSLLNLLLQTEPQQRRLAALFPSGSAWGFLKGLGSPKH